MQLFTERGINLGLFALTTLHNELLKIAAQINV